MTFPEKEAPMARTRDRRQARMRHTIQEEAFRLFERHGYDATPVEQIAAAADISTRTFFRYFPSKEAVVFWPRRAPDLRAFVEQRPTHESALDAVRRGITDGLATFYLSDREQILRSLRLAFRTSNLRPGLFGQQVAFAGVIAGILAERQGSDPGDIGVRALGAALSAALYVALEDWQADDGINDLGGLIDRALASLDGDLGASSAGSYQSGR
jgi:AcrR family transcriptional regulator